MSDRNPPLNTENVQKTRPFLFWRKAILALFLLLVSALYWLLYTGSGAQFLVNQLSRNVESLAIRDAIGSVMSGLTIKSLEWQTDTLNLNVESVSIELRALCLLSGEVCIDSIVLTKPRARLILTSQPTEVDEEDNKTAPIQLPFPILVDSLSVADLEFTVISEQETDSEIHISNKKLHLQAFEFYQHVDIASLALDKLTIHQLQDTDNELPHQTNNVVDLDSIRNWQYQPVTLANLHIPLNINLKAMTVSEFDFQQKQQSVLAINNLRASIKANTSGAELAINSMEWSDWKLSAALTLSSEWQIQAAINGKIAAGSASPVTLGTWQVITSGSKHTDKIGTVALDLAGDPDELQFFGRILSSDNAEIMSVVAQASPAKNLLPVNAEINWRDLVLENKAGKNGKEFIRFKKGQLNLSGDVNQYQLTLESENDSNLTNVLLLTSFIELNAGESKSVVLQDTKLTSQYASINLSADAQLEQGLIFHSDLTITDTDASAFMQDLTWVASDLLPERITKSLESLGFNGNLTVTGKLTENQPEQPQLLILDSKIAGSANWLNKPLALNSQAALQIPIATPEHFNLKLSEMRLALADNQLNANGQISLSSVNADIRLAAVDLSQIWPGSTGSVAFNLSANGPFDKLNINSTMQANHLKWLDYSAQTVTFDSRLDWDDSNAFKLEGQVVQAIIKNVALSADLSTAGNLENHQIDIAVTSESLDSRLQFSGGFSESAWQGQLIRGSLGFDQFQFKSDRQADIAFGWSPASLAVTPHCWRHQQAAFCAEQLTFNSSQLTANLTGQRLPVISALKPLLPDLKTVQTSSLLDFSSHIDWRLTGLPQWQMNAAFSPAKWRFDEELPAVNVEKFTLNSQLQGNEIEADFILSGAKLGTIDSEANLLLPPKLSAIKMGEDGNITVKTQLVIKQLDTSAFLSLLPQLQSAKGIIDGKLQGQWRNNLPDLQGALYLSGGDIISDNLGLHISDINQTLTFEQNKASIEGTFVLGDGMGALSGELDWRNKASINLHVKGEELGFQDGEQINARFSPDLTLTANAGGADLTGKLLLPSALIKIKKLPYSVALPTSDIVLVDAESPHNTSPFPVTLSLDLAIDPQDNKDFRLEAFGLNTALQGSLSLKGSNERLSATGEINLTDGRYQAWGQQLLIQDGELRFSGPLDEPFLYARAIRDPAYTEDKVIAGLMVEGQARKPRVSIYSEPEMSQSEALSYLTRGKSLRARTTDSDEAVLTGMLLNFGLSKSENRIGLLGKKVGIEDLSVDMSGQGGNTKVAVSGSLSENLKVSYGVGVFSAVSEVSLRFQLLPQMYLEAVSGLTNAVDLYYQFDDREPQEKSHVNDQVINDAQQ